VPNNAVYHDRPAFGDLNVNDRARARIKQLEGQVFAEYTRRRTDDDEVGPPIRLNVNVAWNANDPFCGRSNGKSRVASTTRHL
jgi:hypothetical protein